MKKTTTTTINVVAFIVPNGATTIDKAPEGLDFVVNKNIERLKTFGIDYNCNEPSFQCWCYCPEDREKSGEDNWTDHGISEEYINYFTGDYAPNRLPLSMIEGKKEGDVVTTVNDRGTIINITLQQLGHRYESFGPFEEVVKQLMLHYPAQQAWENDHEYVTYGKFAETA